MSAIPATLRNSLLALVLLAGLGGGAYIADGIVTQQAQRDAWLQAVAADRGVSDAVRIAMVLGRYYESGDRHIGTPYIDKLGKGQPLTVCNGLTGAEVVAGRYYSPAECYQLEKRRYLRHEVVARSLLTHWDGYDPFVQATFLDFLHNKGDAAFAASTMRRKANAGDLIGACRENPRWNKGTVGGVSTVLPGLVVRGGSNDEICREWRLEDMT